MKKKTGHQALRERKATDPPLGWEIPTNGRRREPERDPGSYSNRCATDGCKGFGLRSTGYCATCSPTEAMMRLMKAMADGAQLRALQRGLFSKGYLVQSDDTREAVRLNTIEGALKRKLINAVPFSHEEWGFRLSKKGKAILDGAKESE